MAQGTTNSGAAASTADGQATSTLPDDIRESIALGSFTSISGQPSSLSNLALGNTLGNTNLSQQNTVAYQQALNALGQTVTGAAVHALAALSPMEATAVVKLDTGNDVAEQMADLQATIGAFPTRGRRLPRIRRDPNGRYFTTVTEEDFPLTLTVNSRLRRPYATRARGGGMVFALKPANYPFDITLKGAPPQAPSQIQVPASQFPVTIQLSTPPATQPAGQNTRAIQRSGFPVQIILTQG